jgi:hypothetical protein
MRISGRMVRTVVLTIWGCSGVVLAQAPPAGPPVLPEQTRLNPQANCLEPPPLVSWEDYHGPMQKVVGAVARKLERKAVTPPIYRRGPVLCSLETKAKFMLFVQDTFDPLSFAGAAFNAALDHAGDTDPTFGQGATGYAKRFGAAFAGQTSARFFKDFAYPTLFSEDPRYYRLGVGSGRTRLGHAMKHTFVTYRDSGRHAFNFSEWLGTASAVAIGTTYHPGIRDASDAAQAMGFSIGFDMGFDILREFWPDIARKFKMPFRQPAGAVPASRRGP